MGEMSRGHIIRKGPYRTAGYFRGTKFSTLISEDRGIWPQPYSKQFEVLRSTAKISCLENNPLYMVFRRSTVGGFIHGQQFNLYSSAIQKQEQLLSHPVIRYPILALEKVTNCKSITSPARGRSVYSGSGGQGGMESSLILHILVKDHRKYMSLTIVRHLSLREKSACERKRWVGLIDFLCGVIFELEHIVPPQLTLHCDGARVSNLFGSY